MELKSETNSEVYALTLKVSLFSLPFDKCGRITARLIHRCVHCVYRVLHRVLSPLRLNLNERRKINHRPTRRIEKPSCESRGLS